MQVITLDPFVQTLSPRLRTSELNRLWTDTEISDFCCLPEQSLSDRSKGSNLVYSRLPDSCLSHSFHTLLWENKLNSLPPRSKQWPWTEASILQFLFQLSLPLLMFQQNVIHSSAKWFKKRGLLWNIYECFIFLFIRNVTGLTKMYLARTAQRTSTTCQRDSEESN